MSQICLEQSFLKCGEYSLDGTHDDFKEYPDFN